MRSNDVLQRSLETTNAAHIQAHSQSRRDVQSTYLYIYIPPTTSVTYSPGDRNRAGTRPDSNAPRPASSLRDCSGQSSKKLGVPKRHVS